MIDLQQVNLCAYLWDDMAEGVHDALLEVVEHQAALSDPPHHTGEVVVQEDDGRRLKASEGK